MYVHGAEPWFYHTSLFIYLIIGSMFFTPLAIVLLTPKNKYEQEHDYYNQQKEEKHEDQFKKFMEEKRREQFKDAPLAENFIKNKQPKNWEETVKDSEFFVNVDKDDNNANKKCDSPQTQHKKQIEETVTQSWTTGLYYKNNNNNITI